MHYVFIIVPLTIMSFSAYSQEKNPFVFKGKAPIKQVLSAPTENKSANQIQEDLSRSQKEEVLLILSEALEKAAVSGGQGVYQIDGFKRYFVMANDDLLLGNMNGKYIIKDASRNKIEYVDMKGYVGVVTENEWFTNIQSIVEGVSKSEATTLSDKQFVEPEDVTINAKIRPIIRLGKERVLSN